MKKLRDFKTEEDGLRFEGRSQGGSPPEERLSEQQPLTRNVSDTARWVAWFRARESERKDACFRDPLAARLAGERDAEMARFMGHGDWAFLARTWWFDAVVRRAVAGTPTPW